jgi:hypothetical protein
MYFLINNNHVHFWEFAFGTANIFLDVFIKAFLHLLLIKISIYNIVGIIFSSCLFENSLRSFLEAKKLENILLIGS